MPSTIKLEIVTPRGTFYSDDVEMVTLPGIEGQLGILPNHVRLFTQMVPGEVVVRKGGKDDFIAVGEGLIEVTGSYVGIATDMAIESRNIDEAVIEEARQRAAARLGEKVSADQVASVNAALAHSLTQLRVKRRHRS
jgi:F-type H+-transporting ATPase subunit epsilon